MIKNKKLKFLSIAAGSMVTLSLVVATPIAVSLKPTAPNQVTTYAASTSSTSSSTADNNQKKNYWIATDLAIGYAVLALVIALIAIGVFCHKKSKKNEADAKQEQEPVTNQVLSNELATRTTDVFKQGSNLQQIDTLIEKEKNLLTETDKVAEINKYLASYLTVDHNNPANPRMYFNSQDPQYLPNVVYLTACPEHNFLYKNKNIICLDKPFDNEKKDILIYDLWSQKITGYAKVVAVLKDLHQTDADVLYASVAPFSTFSRKEFDTVLHDSNQACLLFCDKTVRFDYPVDPTTLYIPLVRSAETEIESVTINEPIVPVSEEIVLETPVENEEMVIVAPVTETVVLDSEDPIELEPVVEETISFEPVVEDVEEVIDQPVEIEETIEFPTEDLVELEPVVEPTILVEEIIETPAVVTEVEEIIDQPEAVEEIVEEIIDEPVAEVAEAAKPVEPEVPEVVEEVIEEITDEPVEPVLEDQEYINELAKASAKVEPVVLNDIELVIPVQKDETKDILKANSQVYQEMVSETPVQLESEVVEEEPVEKPSTWPTYRVKTIVDKQTRENAPVTFLVTKQEKNAVSNSYELNNNNSKNKAAKQPATEYTYKRRRITNLETEMLKKEGKFFKYKPSTHPKVREEQIKKMQEFCDEQNQHHEADKQEN